MNLVRIAHLSKAYDDVPALQDFSLVVGRGEVVALVGPDGAGKTTLMRILCNLLTPDNGEVMIDERDVTKEFEQVKAMIGYMPQTFSLYPDLSVEENLKFYAGIYGQTGEAYRRTRDRLYQFSQLGPFADRRASALSGGMKQKLALSCALLHDPQVLILDEPTTGVDPVSRRYFWQMLLRLKADGVTILVSTPYMDEAERADKTVCLFEGKKLAEGTAEELASQFVGSVFSVYREPSTDIIARLERRDGVKARRFGCGLLLYVDKDLTLDSIADSLSSAGIDRRALRPVTATLEDRFIQMMEAHQ
jgi:ABC-2 type transport system ATP-binding protein